MRKCTNDPHVDRGGGMPNKPNVQHGGTNGPNFQLQNKTKTINMLKTNAKNKFIPKLEKKTIHVRQRGRGLSFFAASDASTKCEHHWE